MVDSTQHTIAILRECKNKWERRCSLTPTEVKLIVANGIKVIVQPSSNRCYTEDEFQDVGAVIQEDVTEASVIFGVKEVPMENLMSNKTYFFFSHTIKAQDYNMPLLDRLLELNVRMVDFECIREKKVEGKIPQRLVAFGRYAGIAGAFDFLRGCGEYMLEKKYQTPFVFIGSSYMYSDYADMCQAVARVSQGISKGGLPRDLVPMVFAVTGTGRVAQGSMEVLEQLPHVNVPPKDLRAFLADPVNKANNKQIVISQFTTPDLVKRIDGGKFDKAEYREKPEEYIDTFKENLDLVSWLVNGIYWEAKYPRILSKEDMRKSVEKGDTKFMGLTDISADYEGSVEFTSRFTSIEEPFLLYDPIKSDFKEKISEMGSQDILFHSVDHLPAEMPKEASNHFGSQLMPFVKQVVESDFSKPFEEMSDLPDEIRGAVITAHGKLTPDYDYIANLRKLNERVGSDGDDGSSVGMQGFCVCLTGHLFDNKSFNKIIDICEGNSILFRVVEWELGMNAEEETSVTIQGMSMNELALDEAQKEIESFCKDSKIRCQPASGPAYDKKITKKIHQDHQH